jgi:hypothetical protein
MSGTLDLNRLVLGHDASRIFPIEIAENKSVRSLRKAIKDEKEHAFQHVDANNLILWQVSIPVNRNLTENLRKLDFVDDGSLLPVKRLSGVFSDQPEDEHLHIVVRVPPAGEYELLAFVITLHHFSSSPHKSALRIITTTQS